MIRLFAAVEAPPEVGEALAPLMTGIPGARWRPLEALHVTLRFFGEIPESLAADLDLELEGVRGSPFELAVAGVGSFGEGHRIDTLWAGLDPSDPLVRLQARCEAAARRAGLKPETRAFRPHLTLAYLNGASEPRIAAWIGGNNLVRTPPWRVERFGLYSSWLGPDGSRYELEREYPLRP